MAFLVIFLLFLLAQGVLLYKWLTDWVKRIKSTWHQTLLTLGFLLFFVFLDFAATLGYAVLSFFTRNPIKEEFEGEFAAMMGLSLGFQYLVFPFLIISVIGGILVILVVLHYFLIKRKLARRG